MRRVDKFSEEHFINYFALDLKTKAICFSDISHDLQYLENELKPMLTIVDFMFIHHFISEDGYYKCRDLYNEVLEKAKQSLHEKWKKEAEMNEIEAKYRIENLKTYCENFINNHKVGDIVKINGTLIGTHLPRYLEGGTLTIIGFTKKGNVKCQWDNETFFSISPCYLKDC